MKTMTFEVIPPAVDRVATARLVAEAFEAITDGVSMLSGAISQLNADILTEAELRNSTFGVGKPCGFDPKPGEVTLDPSPSDGYAEYAERPADSPFVSQGPIRRILDLRRTRREIVAKLRENGIDGEQVVGKLGDGSILELLIKYGPSIYAVARAIAAMFGFILPPLPVSDAESEEKPE